ncbi:MAG TPA: DUF2252 domain-containing protein [Acidimicrobiales bacterium]|nr:DUF2252 domain-containing protein [Acidimicrobiales bacterium]
MTTAVTVPGTMPAAGTPQERMEVGKSLRGQAPRSSHADLSLGPDRPDPVALLEEQAASRVPDLVPVRHGRMMESEFAFFRGAAVVMAADLAGTPRTGVITQICGDAHLCNFGLFGSPERHLVFDLNDFDETYPGPWEWDVKRLAASIAIAGRARGFSTAQRRRAVLQTANGYRAEMQSLASLGHLDAWYQHVDADDVLASVAPALRPPNRKQVQQLLAKARSHDSLQALGKLTRTVDGQVRIVSNPPVVVAVEDMLSEADAARAAEVLMEVAEAYRATLRPDVRNLFARYQLVHVAHKVVGVGSVGTRAWVGLFLGRDGRDPLFIQAKEAQASVIERFLPAEPGAGHNGERVVAGQHLMQAVSDLFLGWARTVGFDGQERDFYLRQLRDWKGSFDPQTAEPVGLALYGQLCGATLARAHARSGDRMVIAGYLGNGPTFDRAIAEFAEAYADQNARDYAAFRAAIDEGRIAARPGV